MIKSILILVACFFLGCNQEKNPETGLVKGSTILKDYAKNPIDKAKNLNNINDQYNKRFNENLDDFKN